MTQPQILLTLKIVQERTQLSRTTLYRLCRAGHLHPVRIGRALRFRDDEIAVLMQMGVPATDRSPRR